MNRSITEAELEREAYLNALARKRIINRRKKAADREIILTILSWASLFGSMYIFSIIGYAMGAR